MTEPQTDYEFRFVAGRPCLDFLNTLGDRGKVPPSEHLNEYADLVGWSAAGGMLEAAEAEDLRLEAGRHPRKAASVVRRATRLREALYRIFTAVTGGSGPAPADLEILNRELALAMSSRVLVPAGDQFHFYWSGESGDGGAPALDRPLWTVAESAADVLSEGALERVKSCAADTCNWMFMDDSRNRSRQWCEMETCGNRAKARRHYAKCRAEDEGAC